MDNITANPFIAKLTELIALIMNGSMIKGIIKKEKARKSNDN